MYSGNSYDISTSCNCNDATISRGVTSARIVFQDWWSTTYRICLNDAHARIAASGGIGFLTGVGLGWLSVPVASALGSAAIQAGSEYVSAFCVDINHAPLRPIGPILFRNWKKQ